MAEKMEVSIGSYGRMMFEMMSGTKKNMPDHWESIADEAKPLVEKLLELNDKMEGGGYSIVGRKVKGKQVLSKAKRIELAQEHDLLTTADKLEEGDYFWLYKHYDHEMYMGQDDPLVVDEKTKKGVYFEMSHMGGSHTEKIGLDEKVLKASDDLNAAYKASAEAGAGVGPGTVKYADYVALRDTADAKEKEFTSDEYWLKRADELGI